MEHLGSLFESFPLGRRLRVRPLEHEAVADLPARPDQDQSLEGYIPSALIPADQRLRAMVIGGAPAWSRRLKRIDTLTTVALADLETAWRKLAWARRQDPERFSAEWREHAARADFSRVNDLIGRHNLHFPVEANLAMDVRTGDYIGFGGGDYRRLPLDTAWVLERFPPDLATALSDESCPASSSSAETRPVDQALRRRR